MRAVDGGIAYGHTGATLGHNTYAFSSPDGERQVSVTLTIDDMLVPNPELATALNELLVTGPARRRPHRPCGASRWRSWRIWTTSSGRNGL